MHTNPRKPPLGGASCASVRQCAQPWGITYQRCKFDRKRIASDCGCGSCRSGLQGVPSASGGLQGLKALAVTVPTNSSLMPYQRNPWGFWRPWYGYRRTVYTRPPETLAENVARQTLQATANSPQSGEAVGYIAGQMAALRALQRSDMAILVPAYSDPRWYTPWTQERFTQEFMKGVWRVQDELKRRHAESYIGNTLMRNTAATVWTLLNR